MTEATEASWCSVQAMDGDIAEGEMGLADHTIVEPEATYTNDVATIAATSATPPANESPPFARSSAASPSECRRSEPDQHGWMPMGVRTSPTRWLTTPMTLTGLC